MKQVRKMTHYSTSQTSGDHTIDMYWDLVNNRYTAITQKLPYAYDRSWVDGCISDAKYGIKTCDLSIAYNNCPKAKAFKSVFLFIIKQLELIKQEM